MSDSMILYAGVFCFGLILLGFVLTVVEFRKTSSESNGDAISRQRLSPRGMDIHPDTRG
jgi:hypothetical protein